MNHRTLSPPDRRLFVMASVALGYWVHPGWFLFTAFVGLNLFQSAFTNWCPMITILRKLTEESACNRPASRRV
jgi:hypothetical protein